MKTFVLLAAVSVAGAVDFVWPFSGPLTAVLFIVSILFILGAIIDYFPGQVCVGDDGETLGVIGQDHFRDRFERIGCVDGVTLAANERMKVGDGTSHQYISIDGAAANERNVRFQSNNVDRSHMGADSPAEGGSDAGSDLIWRAYDDSGSSLGNAMKLKRSNQQVLFQDGSVSAPSVAGSNYTDSGLHWTSSGLVLVGQGSFGLTVASDGVLLSDAIEMGPNFIEFLERSDPAAPSANEVRLYAKDNGSGKTQLISGLCRR